MMPMFQDKKFTFTRSGIKISFPKEMSIEKPAIAVFEEACVKIASATGQPVASIVVNENMRDPEGEELYNVVFRLVMKNYRTPVDVPTDSWTG